MIRVWILKRKKWICSQRGKNSFSFSLFFASLSFIGDCLVLFLISFMEHHYVYALVKSSARQSAATFAPPRLDLKSSNRSIVCVKDLLREHAKRIFVRKWPGNSSSHRLRFFGVRSTLVSVWIYIPSSTKIVLLVSLQHSKLLYSGYLWVDVSGSFYTLLKHFFVSHEVVRALQPD